MPKTKCVIDRIKEADKKLIEKFGADAFDGFDCRPENSYSEVDRDDAMPEHIKFAIETTREAKGESPKDDI
ncbi:MAG: hypothetical protein ACOYBW_06715 [Fluviibacter phosphoraccumulans]